MSIKTSEARAISVYLFVEKIKLYKKGFKKTLFIFSRIFKA